MPHKKDIDFISSLQSNGKEISIADIGCGPDKYPGATGIDIVERTGIVDIIHNLDSYPWPIEKSSFDVVICNHLMEHVHDFVSAIGEIHRILKPGGYLITRTPHYSHIDSWVDPTHQRHLTTRSFDYFIKDCPESGLYTNIQFTSEEVHLSFGSGIISTLGWLLSRLSMRQYEKYWCRLFPAATLYFRLSAIK